MRWSPLFLDRDHPSATFASGLSIKDASFMRLSLHHHAGLDRKCVQPYPKMAPCMRMKARE